jgi:acetoacetate decarboxylase
MARLRYVKSAAELARSRETNPEHLSSTVRSLRVVYETDAAVARAVLPRPLAPAARPTVALTVSQVAIHVTPEFTFELGSAIFGVAAVYEDVPGTYLITMPMTTEAAVVGGRETYGEPKKLAEIAFTQEGPEVTGVVTRMGVPYIEVRATLGEERGPRAFTEHAYCFKAQPSCDPARAFDHDPLLVRLAWRHTHTRVAAATGTVTLRESPFDPVADLPVRRLVAMEYEEGTTESDGTVLRAIPGDWLLPFLHQRYDDHTVTGVELA